MFAILSLWVDDLFDLDLIKIQRSICVRCMLMWVLFFVGDNIHFLICWVYEFVIPV